MSSPLVQFGASETFHRRDAEFTEKIFFLFCAGTKALASGASSAFCFSFSIEAFLGELGVSAVKALARYGYLDGGV